MLTTNQTKDVADALDDMLHFVRDVSKRNAALAKPDPLIAENERLNKRIAELQIANAGLASELLAAAPKAPLPTAKPVTAKRVRKLSAKVLREKRVREYLRYHGPRTLSEIYCNVTGAHADLYQAVGHLILRGGVVKEDGRAAIPAMLRGVRIRLASKAERVAAKAYWGHGWKPTGVLAA